MAITSPINFPYTAVELTDAINYIPNTYGLINELNIFPSDPIATRVVEVRREQNTLTVLPVKTPGATPTEAARARGDTLYVEVPHVPYQDTLKPEDIQGFLQLSGRTLRPTSAEEEMAKRLAAMRRTHDITLEYMRMEALKGILKDGDGTTVYNWYTTFGITKKTVDFVLGTSTTDIIAKCEEVYDHIVTNLKGETMSGVEVIVSSSFFNKFVQHAKVEKYWLQTQNALQLVSMPRDRRGGNWGRTFNFPLGNLVFTEYKGVAPLKAGSAPFVAVDYGHAYPAGTGNAFQTYLGPAHHWDYVNDPGMELYVSTKVLDHGRGVEIVTQANPLPICKRPELLVEVRTSD